MLYWFSIFSLRGLQNFNCYDCEVALTHLKSRRLLQRRSKFGTFMYFPDSEMVSSFWQMQHGQTGKPKTLAFAHILQGFRFGWPEFRFCTFHPWESLACAGFVSFLKCTCTSLTFSRILMDKVPETHGQQGVGEGPAAARWIPVAQWRVDWNGMGKWASAV